MAIREIAYKPPFLSFSRFQDERKNGNRFQDERMG